MRSLSSLSVRVLGFAVAFTCLEIDVRLVRGDQVAPIYVTWSFAGGILVAILFAWMLPRTRLRTVDRIILVWLVVFVVQQFNNMVEGYFFTNLYPSVSPFVGAVFLSLLTTLAQGIMAGLLFVPEIQDGNLVSELSSYFKERTPASWAWRIAAASVMYFPIYFIFGALISPFIIPYYTDPSLGLRLPPFTVIIPLELFRGFLYVMSLLPVVAVIRATRRSLLAIIASILYVPGALLPLMSQQSLPAGIVPFHLIEILADSILYGAAITYLLVRKPK